MKRNPVLQHGCIQFCLFLSLLWLGGCAHQTAETNAPAAVAHAGHGASTAPQANATPRIPDHFMSAAAAKPFPATLDPKTFSSPSVVKSYQLAKDIPEVLAQQPCYCYCDTGWGHKSLLDCHIDDHSAGCQVCLKEALLTGQMHAEGKSAEQIREAIIRGEWQKIQTE